MPKKRARMRTKKSAKRPRNSSTNRAVGFLDPIVAERAVRAAAQRVAKLESIAATFTRDPRDLAEQVRAYEVGEYEEEYAGNAAEEKVIALLVKALHRLGRAQVDADQGHLFERGPRTEARQTSMLDPTELARASAADEASAERFRVELRRRAGEEDSRRERERREEDRRRSARKLGLPETASYEQLRDAEYALAAEHSEVLARWDAEHKAKVRSAGSDAARAAAAEGRFAFSVTSHRMASRLDRVEGVRRELSKASRRRAADYGIWSLPDTRGNRDSVTSAGARIFQVPRSKRKVTR